MMTLSTPTPVSSKATLKTMPERPMPIPNLHARAALASSRPMDELVPI
jgi:hypothetical protein